MSIQTQTNAVVQICNIIVDTVRELGGVPSGHLYSQLMGYMSVETYNQLISLLLESGRLKQTNHYLTAV